MPKLELKQINGDSYYCTARLAVGVIVNPATQSVILIDSGLDEDGAKAICTLLRRQELSVAAIVNTHSHADHCGGNAFFTTQFPDIKIYATAFERPFIENTSLEPHYFSSGATPFQELHNKFLEAAPSSVTAVIPYVDGQIVVNDTMLEVITLPGHTPGMIGIGNTKDRVFYCGDAIFGEDTFRKHGVLYFTNITDTRNSLSKLLSLTIQYDSFLLYHGGLTRSVEAIVEIHLRKIDELEHFIYDSASEKTSVELLNQAVMKKYEVPNTVVQYSLTRTCVLAYLASLQEQNKIMLLVDDGVLSVRINLEPSSKASV